MISNPERTVLVSSIGWVDQDALWRFDVPTANVERLPLGSGARYVSLHSSGSDYFSVAHHHDGAQVELTVRRFSDPTAILARAVVAAGEKTLSGDLAVWDTVPRLYIEYLRFDPWKDYVLLKIAPALGRIEVQRLEWYDERYDKDYQGIVDVLELSGANLALVSVQRSSTLILHDLETGQQRGSVALAGRGGNPVLRLRNGGDEVWASDYDTVVVLDRRDWRTVRRARLQSAFTGTQQFIGDYSFAPDAPVCVVARPFSGDVLGVDIAGLKTRQAARVGRQPLEVAALPRGEVVARDWKTGDLLRGTLERRWFAAWRQGG